MTHKYKTSQHVGVLNVLGVLCVLAFNANAIAQDPDTAFVPFIVNVNAKVKAVQGTDSVEISVTANEADTLKIPLGKTSSVRYKTSQNGQQGSAGVIINNNRGKILLNLPVQGYKSADISLYSVNGKRVLRGKASASETVKSISRPNLVAGVYLLAVKGGDGQSFSNRVTHRGGSFSINVGFASGSESGLNGLPIRAVSEFSEVGDWEITVSTDEYKDAVYKFSPTKGDNPLQNVKLSGGSHFDSDVAYGSFTDTRGGIIQSYRTVKIEDLTWMAENLNLNTLDSWCYDDVFSNCNIYGRMYTWDAAMSACPSGWLLPTREDWNNLVLAVGDNAGTKLKSETGYNPNEYVNGNGTDEFGFSALPGGYLTEENHFFDHVGNWGYWWSATELGSDYAYKRVMGFSIDSVDEYWNFKEFAFSVRCVKDERP